MTTTAPATTPAPKRRTGRALFAGAAAIALLSAGGGSFALWQDSATVQTGDQEIVAGTLDLEAGTEGTWTYAGTEITPTLIVPGDELTYSQQVDITAAGDHLKATLTADLANLGIPGDGSTQSLESLLQPTLTINDETQPKFSTLIEPTKGTQTLNVKVTITFPDTTGEQFGQGQKVTLGDLPITLTQNKI